MMTSAALSCSRCMGPGVAKRNLAATLAYFCAVWDLSSGQWAASGRQRVQHAWCVVILESFTASCCTWCAPSVCVVYAFP